MTALLLLLAMLPAEPMNWELQSDRDGVKIFEAEVPKSSVVAIAGEAIIEAPLQEVSKLLMDIEHKPIWTPNLKEARILEKISDKEWIEYNHVTTPFLVRDRDFIIAAQIEDFKDPKKNWAIHYRSVENSKAPKTRFVRGIVHSASFRLTSLSNNRTHIWAEARVDPKGAIPKWLVNIFQKKWPRRTIAALKRQVAQTRISH